MAIGKALAGDRLDGQAVDRDEAALEAAETEPEVGAGGGVDDTQAQAPARRDAHHVGIGERAVVGQIGVEFDIVEIHLHAAHGHGLVLAGHHVHTRHVAGLAGHHVHRRHVAGLAGHGAGHFHLFRHAAMAAAGA